MKIQRNDPCPCGSGKKYKHCCLAAAAAEEESPDILALRRVRGSLEGYIPRMQRFIDETYGDSAFAEAWTEFFLFDEEDLGVDNPHAQLFTPWFFHHWTPDPADSMIEDDSLFGRSPTEVFLERRARQIDPTLRNYLQGCLTAAFSFHEVLSCQPGHGFRARDLFTGQVVDVLERQGTEALAVGDILYAQIAQVEGIAMLEATASFSLPLTKSLEVIDLREELVSHGVSMTAESLRDYDLELRELFFALADSVLDPVMPELRNMDGDLLDPQELIFDIDSIDACVTALKSLAQYASEQDLENDTERDRSGALKRVRLVWTQDRDGSTPGSNIRVMGSIDITRKRLRAEVNSGVRAKQLRSLIEERLGNGVRYRMTKMQSMEFAFQNRGSNDAADEAAARESARLKALPEVQAHLRKLMAEHYEAWVETPLPALDGKTPAQAVKDPVGREKVSVLVRQVESTSRRGATPVDEEVLNSLRERLGLARGDF